MRSGIKSQAGFSLVELMVVVAIIGILATVAIPKFNAFIAKSRQTEAQSQLSTLFTAEKAFVAQFQGYTVSFITMGFLPEGQLHYNCGFGAAALANTTTNYQIQTGQAPDITSYSTGSYSAVVANTALIYLLADATGAPPVVGDITSATGYTVPATPWQTFTAACGVTLTTTAGVDQWTINDGGKMMNTRVGIN